MIGAKPGVSCGASRAKSVTAKSMRTGRPAGRDAPQAAATYANAASASSTATQASIAHLTLAT